MTRVLPNAQILCTDSGDQIQVPVLESPQKGSGGGEGKAFNSSQLSTLVAYQKQRWVKGGTFDYGAQGRDHRARCICNFVLGKQLARLASGNGAGCERAGLGHMTPRRQVSVV